jgi:tRNA(Ile)-lysidine synthase
MSPEEVLELVRAGGLLPRHGSVVAMLSGGRDSVCLLDLAQRLCGPRAVCALHVNYGLRPESDGDERHCRELCERLGVALEVVRAQRPAAVSGNLQAWARDLRYEAAMRVAREWEPGPSAVVTAEQPSTVATGEPFAPAGTGESSAPAGTGESSAPAGTGEPSAALAAGESSAVVATGHTASDQVETILYRLAASPGRRALLGMAPHEGRLVRPLLSLTREQTAAYCRARGLIWREDTSNADERYARARVRHGLVPALAAVHPAAQANVLRTAELLREEATLLDGLVQAELGDAHTIAVARLRGLHPALARLIVVRLAELAAGTFVPQAGARVAEILALSERAGGRAELHVGGLVAAVVENGHLAMVKLPPRR